jgi:hypothetical protein
MYDRLLSGPYLTFKLYIGRNLDNFSIFFICVEISIGWKPSKLRMLFEYKRLGQVYQVAR